MVRAIIGASLYDEPTLPAPVIRVFGGVGVEGPDGPLSIGGRQQRRLLALLVIRAGSMVDIDWSAEYLWADDDRPEATTPPAHVRLAPALVVPGGSTAVDRDRARGLSALGSGRRHRAPPVLTTAR